MGTSKQPSRKGPGDYAAAGGGNRRCLGAQGCARGRKRTLGTEGWQQARGAREEEEAKKVAGNVEIEGA